MSRIHTTFAEVVEGFERKAERDAAELAALRDVARRADQLWDEVDDGEDPMDVNSIRMDRLRAAIREWRATQDTKTPAPTTQETEGEP